jgi:glutathione S-transferase
MFFRTRGRGIDRANPAVRRTAAGTSLRNEEVERCMYRLYDYLPSGNGYKCRLVLKHLQIPYEYIEVDIKSGASRTPEFLAKNPNGRIPVLEVPGKGYLPESHAIISFLADGSDLIPAEAFDRGRMWQWMCFEQYNLEPTIGTARFWVSVLGKTRNELGEKLLEKKERRIRGARCIGRRAARTQISSRRVLFAGRHRAVRLHPCCSRRRLRSRALPKYPRLVRPRR